MNEGTLKVVVGKREVQGVCGTGLCDVLEGERDHRDVYFTDDEKAANDAILMCCSRSKSSRLVLDI
jgi:vanillate O-demethylase ferredoxin subunit